MVSFDRFLRFQNLQIAGNPNLSVYKYKITNVVFKFYSRLDKLFYNY